MAKKKKNKPAKPAKYDSEFEAHRKMVGKALYSKGKSAIIKSKYIVQKDVRAIINEAREAKDAVKRTSRTVAKNGIKDLKIDGTRLMNFLKDIKFKETPSQSSNAQLSSTTVRQESIPGHSSAIQRKERITSPSYYDIWYNLIYTELRMKNLKE